MLDRDVGGGRISESDVIRPKLASKCVATWTLKGKALWQSDRSHVEEMRRERRPLQTGDN
jgi:hypothetical protein